MPLGHADLLFLQQQASLKPLIRASSGFADASAESNGQSQHADKRQANRSWLRGEHEARTPRTDRHEVAIGVLQEGHVDSTRSQRALESERKRVDVQRTGLPRIERVHGKVGNVKAARRKAGTLQSGNRSREGRERLGGVLA